MNGLDLFSGIGGISIALEPWVTTVAYCENNRYAQAVLLSRQSEGKLHRAPIWDDVQTLKANILPRIDIIFGGFPCQDISAAGYGIGLEGKRSGLFFEIIRLAKETRAPFVFLENVPAIRTRGLQQVVEAFAEIGYDCRWTCLSAKSVGAEHKRERWFMLSHASCSGLERLELSKNTRVTQPKLADISFQKIRLSSDGGDVREINELPRPMDRIKCLGNSVVPMQAREAFKLLAGVY